ncbi:aminoacyl-tRNA hydrolase [Clostridium disporicum]|uniref:aminoacyl-tRNA hydrolase n=1 Tax=Clostridium disporicum TaxID=84024 RepID=UPI0034A4E9CA
MSNKAMYILVNGDIKIGKGKLAGQVGHAVCSYLYRNYIRSYDGNLINVTDEMQEFLDDYMEVQKKIILKAPQSKLEELEEAGYITIRDKGLTQLEPNTLTCVCFGIFDRDKDDMPEWLKELKLYNK